MHLLGLNGRNPVVEASVRGDPASVGIGPDMKPKPRSGIDIGDAEATIVAASADEVDRLTVRLEKQLAAEGRSISGPSTSREVAVELVDIPIGINGVTWLRAAAKMALGVMSLSQPEDWLDTSAARQLIGWLWDETPIDDDGNPKFLFPRAPDEEQADLFPPPAHVILQKPSLMAVPAWRSRCLVRTSSASPSRAWSPSRTRAGSWSRTSGAAR
jgi:hypothetical protein